MMSLYPTVLLLPLDVREILQSMTITLPRRKRRLNSGLPGGAPLGVGKPSGCSKD